MSKANLFLFSHYHYLYHRSHPHAYGHSEEAGSESETSSGQGWIAGAVIGPVAGAAIIGAAVFFYLRSKKHLLAAPVQQVYYQGPYYGAPAVPKNTISLGTSELANAQYPNGPTGAATEIQGFPVAEMPSTRQAHELSSRW